jgi:hypothetical protein
VRVGVKEGVASLVGVGVGVLVGIGAVLQSPPSYVDSQP